jgi:hypothetical protein
MKKVEKEFQEFLFTKTEGRMLEQLTVSSCGLIGSEKRDLNFHATHDIFYRFKLSPFKSPRLVGSLGAFFSQIQR